MTTTLNTLPSQLRDAVLSLIAERGWDVTSARAMESECETLSRALASRLDGMPIEDPAEDDPEWWATAESSARLMWPDADDIPADVADDELAIGHVVCWVDWDGDEYEIDLTAAQFPQLGWTGPQARHL